MNSNGSYAYDSVAGAPNAETINERRNRERYWRSLGKKIRKGARVKRNA